MKFRSVVPDISFPAFVDTQRSSLLAMQYQFEISQRLDRQVLFNRQLEQAAHLIQHAKKYVPFYQQALADIDTDRLVEYDYFRQLPILSRNVLQELGKEIITIHLPDGHGEMFDVTTSGSTGKQLHLKSTAMAAFMYQAFTMREHLWHQRDFSGKLAVIRRFEQNIGLPPDGSMHQGWGPELDYTFETGSSCVLNVKSSTEQQIQWLQKHQPDYLLTYPSVLLEMARYCEKNNTKLDFLKELRTLGEIVTDEIRHTCKRVFGLAISDIYSCQEAGYLAIQCPEQGSYHIQAENVLLEVLDDNNQPCKPGYIGRVVITCLNNFATPLIRYDIGDYAEVGRSCSCGRTLPVLKRIMGRVRNLLTFPDGSRQWPVVGSDAYDTIADIKQFQFIQHSPEEIEMKLVVGDKPAANQEAALKQHINNSLGYNFDLSLSYCKEIERSKGGKFEDFISML